MPKKSLKKADYQSFLNALSRKHARVCSFHVEYHLSKNKINFTLRIDTDLSYPSLIDINAIVDDLGLTKGEVFIHPYSTGDYGSEGINISFGNVDVVILKDYYEKNG